MKSENITTKIIIDALVRLGDEIKTNIERQPFEQTIERCCKRNPFFEPSSVRFALLAVAEWLSEDVLTAFAAKYPCNRSPKTILCITAGNIPCAGFADWMYVLLTNNRFLGRLSHKDDVLLPFLSGLLTAKEPLMASRVSFAAANQPIGSSQTGIYDAVIATGSDASAQYFDYYFKSVPHIIRKNRYSVAILSPNAGAEDLKGIADDCLLHLGLGCRNVRKIFLPFGFDLSRLTAVFADYPPVQTNNKYRNNIDYQRAIRILNNVPFVDGGNVLFEQNEMSESPLGVVFYEFYASFEGVLARLAADKEKIQCVVSDIRRDGLTPCGFGQKPRIDEFADGVDIMAFLLSLTA
ncbi:MAG: hypothetical protein LBL74_01525 [Bacteroidales bacterium]|nr:hypothetical protein [Bacteroidales bacterium]